MILRPARESDFPHLETFVWQAIFPAFDRPELSAAQRAENDALVEGARTEVLRALEERDTAVFVAIDPKTRTLAGYLIADAAPAAYAQIRRIIVKRAYWGKGVAAKLMDEATNYIGRDRAVSAAVRHYNERALAFFAKHDFVHTGETTGDHAIPRVLLLREAYEVLDLSDSVEEASDQTLETSSYWADDFPTGADEPIFEALPDYRLSVDETPLFKTGENALTTESEPLDFGETSLSDDQLSELEAFIARARARKGTPAPQEAPAVLPRKQHPAPLSDMPAETAKDEPASAPVFDRSKIEFEVDYGEDQLPELSASPAAAAAEVASEKDLRPGFEFAFEATPAESEPEGTSEVEAPSLRTVSEPETPDPVTAKPVITVARETKECPDCGSELPVVARFCFNCGHPQPEPDDPGSKAPDDEFLQLSELSVAVEDEAEPDDQLELASLNDRESVAEVPPGEHPASESIGNSKGGFAPEQPKAAQDNASGPRTSAEAGRKNWTLSELKIAFREYLQEQLMAYFGVRQLKTYISRLEGSTSYHTLRDGSLTSLQSWLNNGVYTKATASRRRRDVFADLAEYFIVETAGDLSNGILPQRLLRHQSINWETADLFKVVMDYLDFDRENELIYTDFVTMPTKALRNATKSFIRAGKDERVFLICDQSLLSQAKHGFAVTDAGLYWKNVLQPAGELTFTTLREVRLEQGHLLLDGQFFNAGSTLNLKMALLLNKLRRFSVGDALA